MRFMNNNIFCGSCGTQNENDAKFCTKCGMQIIQNNNYINNNYSMVDNRVNNNSSMGTMLGIASLLLYFVAPYLVALIAAVFPASFMDSFSSIAGLCPMSAIVIMIVGRVKYPANKLLKVVMWVIIVSIILVIICFVLFMIWCYVTCVQLDASGCS